MSKLQQGVAQFGVYRMNAQSLKGKARDRAAIHFTCGAAAPAVVQYGDKSPEWSQLSMMAFFVSIHGYKELEKFAADATRQATWYALRRCVRCSDPRLPR